MKRTIPYQTAACGTSRPVYQWPGLGFRQGLGSVLDLAGTNLGYDVSVPVGAFEQDALLLYGDFEKAMETSPANAEGAGQS